MNSKQTFVLIVLFLLTGTSIKAQTFKYAYSGTTLSYEIISVPDHEAAVVNAPTECVNVTVPSVVHCNGEAFKVTEICGCKYGNGAFEDCKYLKSVVLPNTVYRIGNNAFQGCSWLRTISLPSKLEVIEDYAFFGCESLTSISLPASLRSIGRDAFNDTRLSSVTLPASLRELGDGAFSCQTLKTVKLSRDIGFTMGKIVVFTDPYLEYATTYYNKPFPAGFTVWSSSDFQDHVLASPSGVMAKMKEAKISKADQEKLIVPILLNAGKYEVAQEYFPNNESVMSYKKYAEAYQYFAIGEKNMKDGLFVDAKDNFEKARQILPEEDALKEWIAAANDSIAAEQIRKAEQERQRLAAEEKARRDAEIAAEKARRAAEERQVRILVDQKVQLAMEDIRAGRLKMAIGSLQQAIDTATSHDYDYRTAELSRRMDSIRQVQEAVADASRVLEYRDFQPDLYAATDRAIKMKIRTFLTEKDKRVDRNNISFTFYTGNQPSTFQLGESSRALKKLCKDVVETERLQPLVIDGQQVKTQANYRYDIEYVSGTVKVRQRSGKPMVDTKFNLSPQLKSNMERLVSNRFSGLSYLNDGNYSFEVTSMDINGEMEHQVKLKSVYCSDGPQNAWRSLIIPGWGDQYVKDNGKFDILKTAAVYGLMGVGLWCLTYTESTYNSVWSAEEMAYVWDTVTTTPKKNLGIVAISCGAAIWLADIVYVYIKGRQNKVATKKYLGRISFAYDAAHDAPELVYSLRF